MLTQLVLVDTPTRHLVVLLLANGIPMPVLVSSAGFGGRRWTRPSLPFPCVYG